MAAGFTGKAGTFHGFHGPDSKVYPEKWWDEPTVPLGKVSAGISADLLTQVSEESMPGEIPGKQSCRLTSSLNALIVRGALVSPQASEIQQTLVNDEAFDGYWVPTDTGKFRGFTSNSRHFAFILEKTFGVRIGVEAIESTDIIPDAIRRLRAGYALVLEGVSVAGGHARLAYQPEGIDQFFLHDPKYQATTGLYDLEHLGEFQRTSQTVAF